MRHTIILLALLLCCRSALSQSGYTTVTAQVIDPLGTFYANCTGSASFVPSPFATQQALLNGSVFQTDVPISGCDSFGNFTLILADNNQITDGHPQGLQASQWRISICNKGGTPCKATVLTITGATQNITNALQPMPTISNPAGGGNLTRLTLTGTALTSSDFAISGWGTGSLITNVSGSDSGFQVTVTSGTTPCGLGCATVVLTFHDGPWNSIQGVSAQRFGGSGTFTDVSVNNTLSTITLTFLGLVLPSQTYTFGVLISGQSSVFHGTPVINPVLQNPAGPQTINGTLSMVGPVTISGNLTASGGGAFSANYTHSGTELFSGPLSVTGSFSPRSVDTATIYADQLAPSSGLCSVTGSDASAKIQCAINLLPANGGVVNAVNLSDSSGTGSTIIDPGAKSVTLYLGPYTYQIQQLVLESNFHIYGTGMGNRTPSDTSTTVLQSCSTCAATNAVVLGTNGGLGGSTQGVLMDGLRIYGATSDTAIGMNLKTVNGAGTGLWYSTFRNMCVGVCGPSGASANGFSGGTIILDATAASAINQFLDFYNVQAFHTTGGGFALGLLGTNGQMNFIQCEFDGPTRNDGSTVVQIVNSSGNGGPYTIVFTGATVQHGTLGVNIAGAANITFIGTHFETVGEAIQINTGVVAAGIGSSTNISFIQSTCQNFCGNNSGSGWWAKNLSPASGTKVNFWANQIQSSVDASYIGFSNYSGFTSIGDEQSTTGAIAPLQSVGMNIPIPVTFTTTAVASESVTVTGATASSHCWAEPTNSTAAALTGVFLSAPTTNAVTINHSATSGGTFNVFCTPN